MLGANDASLFDGCDRLVMNVVGTDAKGGATGCCGVIRPAAGTVGATAIGEVVAGCLIGCGVDGGGAIMRVVVSILGAGTGFVGWAETGGCIGVVLGTTTGGIVLVMGMAGGGTGFGGGT